MTFTRLIIEGRPLSVYTAGGRWHPTPYGLPSEIRAVGNMWRVVYHDRLYGRRASKSRLAGCAIEHERLVILDPAPPGHEIRATLGHELAHAILFAGKRTDRALRRLTHEQEEAICDLFADALALGCNPF